jgi:hypothetical protein
VKKWVLTVVGVVLLATGALWMLQGAGVAQGSVMTGHRPWVGIGLVVGLVGLGLLFTGVKQLATRRR